MNSLTEVKQSKVDAIDTIEIYFYRYFISPSKQGFLSRSIYDYHRCFGIDDVIATHCNLRLGDTVYEISLEGTTALPYDEVALDEDNLIAYYSCDLTQLPIETRHMARFILDREVLDNRKLNWRDCMRYLCSWLAYLMRPSNIRFKSDFGIKSATISKGKFHLPYTCATQAAYTLSRLFGVEISFDSHLPTTIVYICDYLESIGIGALMEV